MDKKLLVFTHGGGRLGNQIINQINLLSFWIENKSEFDIANLSFTRYAPEYFGDKDECFLGEVKFDASLNTILKFFGDGFDQTPGHKLKNFWNTLRCISLHGLASVRSDAQSILSGPTIKRGVPGNEVGSLNLDDSADISLLQARKLTMLAGWGVRCWDLVQKHCSAIRSRILPHPQYLKPAKNLVSNARSQVDTVVGVHMRQTDYKKWKNGRYYFEFSSYRKWMYKVEKSIEGRVAFIVASDRRQDIRRMSGLSAIRASGMEGEGGHFIESLVELSLCDYIMAPPSTFSGIAAFIGEVPIVPLYEGVEVDRFEKLDNHLFDAISHNHMSKAVK
ncbi:hypothetical protein [Salinibacter ruber]|uniref:hypothetical protein n=1 Tax=Salinibacter ruber TaxID=146919 RepID=UPI0013C35CDF|nr:hypothetical protein [Salinibacter ruber]